MKKIATGAVALALGATLYSLPAFAQRNPNDGGTVAVTPGAKLDSPASTAKPTTPYFGRGADDGGTGPQPTGVQADAGKSQKKSVGQKPAAPQLGRNPNDGGMVDAQ